VLDIRWVAPPREHLFREVRDKLIRAGGGGLDLVVQTRLCIVQPSGGVVDVAISIRVLARYSQQLGDAAFGLLASFVQFLLHERVVLDHGIHLFLPRYCRCVNTRHVRFHAVEFVLLLLLVVW